MTTSTERVQLIIDGVDNTKSAIQSVVKGVALITGAVIAARKAWQGMEKLITRSIEYTTAANTFASLASSIGVAADTMLTDLHAATSGMVSDADLMTGASKLMAMGLASTSDEASRLTELAVKLGAAFGTEAGPALENFALMLANTSYLRLDTFGLSADRARARVAELTEANKDLTTSAAFVQAVLEQADGALERVGDTSETLAGSVMRLKANWQNLTDHIAAAAGPTIQKVANLLANLVEKYGGTIETIAGGVFATLEEMGSVAVGIVQSIALAMGIDFDQLATNSQQWGENIVILFANGMANAMSYVVQVLTSLGNLIAEWLEPHSPPKILPHIDDWGKETIQAYLDGMSEVTLRDAQAALSGIQYYFDQLLNPIEARLTAISREREDILGSRQIDALQRRISQGFSDPEQQRLYELELEQLQLEMEQRAVQAEADTAIGAAQDTVTKLAYENSLIEDQASALKSVAKIADTVAASFQNVGASITANLGAGLNLTGISEKLRQQITDIFAPLHEQLNELQSVWSAVFGTEESDPYAASSGAPQGATKTRGLADIFAAFQVEMATRWATFSGQSQIDAANWALGFVDAAFQALWEGMAVFDMTENDPITWLYNYVTDIADQMHVDYIAELNDLLEDLNEMWDDIANAISKPFVSAYNQVVDVVNAAIDAWNAMPLTSGTMQHVKKKGFSSFASGADYVTNGPELIMVGDNPGGRERVQVTPLSSPNINGPRGGGGTYNIYSPTPITAQNLVANLKLLGAMAR